MMIPHGPDGECFEKASHEVLKPQRIAEGTQVGSTGPLWFNCDALFSLFKAKISNMRYANVTKIGNTCKYTVVLPYVLYRLVWKCDLHRLVCTHDLHQLVCAHDLH